MKIYTKTGDTGETALVSGNRVSKSDPRIEVYGELDELNSRMGMTAAHLMEDPSLESVYRFIHKLQSAVFDLGSNLACEAENRQKYNLPQIEEALISEIESEIDRMDKELTPLRNFILPGGILAAASAHLCRTSSRSVERKLVAYHDEYLEILPQNSLQFLNRLSDYFFVLARFLNRQSKTDEISWKPRV